MVSSSPPLRKGVPSLWGGPTPPLYQDPGKLTQSADTPPFPTSLPGKGIQGASNMYPYPHPGETPPPLPHPGETHLHPGEGV